VVKGLTGKTGLNKAYVDFGENKRDLFILAAFCNATDEQVIAWENEHNVKYPGISRDEGGDDLRYVYGNGKLFGVPTICLIRPDRKIVEKDLDDQAACINNTYVDSLKIVLDSYNIGATGNKEEELLTDGNIPGITIRAAGNRKIMVSIMGADIYTSLLYSSKGRLVQTETKDFCAGVNTIDIQETVSPGMYFMTIKNKNGRKATQKLAIYR